MPNRPGNDDRTTGNGDRERAREISSDASRQNGSPIAGGQSAAGRSRSNRGFASMDPSKQKEIASKGGRAAHAKGTAHEFDSGEAREAGRKGGQAVSRNREHMAAIGRRGGEARGHSRTRGTVQTNSGATAGEGASQNSRAANERQVPLNNLGESNAAAASSTQGARGVNNPLGGERRPSTTDSNSRNESFGNH